MEFNQKQIEFERHIESIIGLTLVEVEYLEIDYEPDNSKPYYRTDYDNLDSIDFSIILYTDKEKLEFFWDEQFFQYGVGLRIGFEKEISTGKKWLVSNREIWKDLVDKQISAVKVEWDKVSTYDQSDELKEEFTYPQTISLRFSNDKRVYISAAELMDNSGNKVIGFTDNLLVTDKDELAENLKLIVENVW